MIDSVEPPARSSRFPWRWSWLAWLACIVFLLAGVPLFLRMPPWCDVTLYDVAAQNIMRGGVHYRDVFDTNLPGFVWLLVGIRRTLGPSIEALRAVDLCIVTATVVLLAKFARRAGADRAGVAWLAAGVAYFYPFTTEFNHAQRDVWMLLPAVAATWLRVRRILAGRATFWEAFLEGALWSAAVWIKPHVVIPAAAIWLLSARRLGAASARPWRAIARDLAGNVSAGLLAGALGLAWIIGTKAGPAFEDVLFKWNASYGEFLLRETADRLGVEFAHFPPFSFLLPFALLIALANIVDARPWSATVRPGVFSRWIPALMYPRSLDAEVTFARSILAVLLFAWAAQAVSVQRMFAYVHVPEIVLLFAVAAANRWAAVPLGIAYGLACGALWLQADADPQLNTRILENTHPWNDVRTEVPRHPLFLPERMRLWPSCFRFDLPEVDYRRRQADVALFGDTFASIDPEQTLEIVQELRRLGVGHGELVCWHDAPHAAFIELNVKPGFRFMHVETALTTVKAYERMKIELVKKQPEIRFVVSDLVRVWHGAPGDVAPRRSLFAADLMPPDTPAALRNVWPMNQPAIFRTQGGRGRFIIHRNAIPLGPLGDCMVPEWPRPR